MEKEHYQQLIIKQLSEGITPEQKAELDQWLQAHPGNQGIKTGLVNAWKHSDLYKSGIDVNQHRDWQKVSGQLDGKSKIIPMWARKWAVAAASVVLLISIGWLVFQKPEPAVLQYTTTEGEIRAINLPDGSIVTLNENSEIRYQEKANERSLDLSGEAFFEVSHDPEHPFSVYQAGTKTTVLGTKFNIDASAYPEIKVSLMEGKISFETGRHDIVVLTPGEEIAYYPDLDSLVQSTGIDENILYWKSKKLTFDNEPISKVIRTLEDYFDKDIELILDKEECRFTGSFEDPKYEEIIEVLQFTYDMDFTEGKTKDQIQIHNCK